MKLCEEWNKIEILKDSNMDQTRVDKIDIVYIPTNVKGMNNLSARVKYSGLNVTWNISEWLMTDLYVVSNPVMSDIRLVSLCKLGYNVSFTHALWWMIQLKC